MIQVIQDASSYNSFNLVCDADFRVQISKNLYWVPFNCLGKSRYTNGELLAMFENSRPEELQAQKLNLYEAIQLFHVVDFRECVDIVSYKDNGIVWQLHKSGKYALETNRGFCASAAAWLNYVIAITYPERGYLHYLRPNGTGHVLNYVMFNCMCYIVDMMALTRLNVSGSPKETGSLRDYRSSRYPTGSCLQTNSLEYFVRFHSRLQKTKGYQFSYFSLPPYSALPPSAIEFVDDVLYYHYMGENDTIVCAQKLKLVQHPWVDVGREFVQYTNCY